MIATLGVFQWQWPLDGWIIVAGVLSAMSCALLGNFLVLRRMSMMGDAISHAVLPGLAIAFLVFESRGSMVMFIGAVIAGMLTALFTQWIHQLGKVEQSASMGVVFTSLFAVGLVLLVQALDHVDLDPGCVLYGAIEAVPMQTVPVLGGQWPRAVVTLVPMFLVNVLFVGLLYKELRISAFDPALATVQGINASLMHYLLMTLVAATTVASFESVGSILVIAMLIVPAAAAHLWTDRLHAMIAVSLVIAALSAVLGHLGAVAPAMLGYADTNTAGMMAVVAGLIFAFSMLAAPRHGVVSRLIRRVGLRLAVLREDVLGLLYRIEELEQDRRLAADERFIGGAVGAGMLCRVALRALVRRGRIRRDPQGYHLTEAGRLEGRDLVRSHRLWETYLHRHLGLAADHVHPTAEKLEHITDSTMRSRLSRGADEPTQDPQGRRIPPDA